MPHLSDSLQDAPEKYLKDDWMKLLAYIYALKNITRLMFHAYTNIIKLSNRVANHYGKLQGGILSDYWVSRCHQPTPSMCEYSLQEMIVTVNNKKAS
ncbi:hypothetical protein CFP56_032898 [Quercus suber]|uniref:Uncharacterized protein n=1 Tax=Quercus suber TaxID=58331 RepID=A0AAW0LTB0_QUESU